MYTPREVLGFILNVGGGTYYTHDVQDSGVFVLIFLFKGAGGRKYSEGNRFL